MTSPSKKSGADLFIVDNSDADWKVREYLQEWTELAHTFDIATGYFEIGALLALDGQWQKLQKLRILMGDEVSRRTKQALLAGIDTAKRVLDASLEKEKEGNEFLRGVPAIVDALRSDPPKIQCRVYTKQKFHAKAYITHAKQAVVGSTALVGSSNFTLPGLTNNVELNVQLRREVDLLQQWYERHWNEAEDITPELLKVIERHTREYLPFEVYAKAMQEFFRGHEMTVGEWETAGPTDGGSRMYSVLDRYQQDGYKALMKIANSYGGAFLCDGVGLGKTFIGMMLIERLVVRERKRVALFVPKAARKPVWEMAIRRYLPHIGRVFTNLEIFNHTDLLRGGEVQATLDGIAELADVVLIDEAHHFRNPGLKGKSRYWRMLDICKGKQLFLLTATPINNSLLDLQHMIELFTQRQADHFKGPPLGIHSLPGHFRVMEKELEAIVYGIKDNQLGLFAETNDLEAGQVLANDSLFREIVVQRSRAYVKASQKTTGGRQALFPERADPQVAEYSIKKTYGRLLDKVEEAFSKKKPLFSLAVYYPLAYYKGPQADVDPLSENRQKQVIGLIRIMFLKRFESSARAFEMSCATLFLKLLAWLTKHCTTPAEKRLLDRWQAQHAAILDYVQEHRKELTAEAESDDADEDIVTDEMLEDIEQLSRDEYKIDEIINETLLDLDQLASFLEELKKFKPAHDDKLKALVKLLKTDPILKAHKVLIFSEFMATARYLKKHLIEKGIAGVDEVDSADKRDRGDVILQFAPYYNESSAAELAANGMTESRVLISTDVLSEGLNLQDATRLINYDLHWNPVRLMQRIGRVDRRLNPDIEAKLVAAHPEVTELRGKVAYWNFLPPEELDSLLRLYQNVSHKTLRISKTFGIEGKKLLTPKDDFDALKEFNQAYEGTPSATEDMKLEYQKLLVANPGLEQRLNDLPGRVFSGKVHPSKDARAVFFCYALPAAPLSAGEQTQTDASVWTEAAGLTAWYLYDLSKQTIADEPTEIQRVIRCKPNTERHTSIPQETLTDIRKKVEGHIKNTYFKRVQAPVGVKATLKCWMELS